MTVAHAGLVALAALTAQVAPAGHAVTSSASLGRLSSGLGDQPFSLEAERLFGVSQTGVYVAEGDVLMIRGQVIIRADRITFDQRGEKALAEGHVTVIEPTSILTCNRVEMRLPELFGGIASADLRIKSPIPEEVRRTLSAGELRRYGKSELIVHGERIDRVARRELEIESGLFTVCDCGDSAPTWAIRSMHATVDLDSGAWLTAPVFYAKGVPVFVLPALYVPLGSRRSGLLIPRFQSIFNPVTGFRVAQPIFLTFGESWDATLAPGFMRNRGPSLATEVRWAATADSRGQAHVLTNFDMGVYDGTPVSLGSKLQVVRYALNLRHDTKLENARLVADLNAIGDPYNLSEFSTTFLTRSVENTMSRVTLSSATRSGDDTRYAGGLLWVQDTRLFRYRGAMGALDPDALRHVNLFSADQNGAGDVRYRFAELRFDASPHPLFGDESPLLGAARLKLDAHSALRSDQPRFVRFDFRPALSMPIQLGGLAVLEPSIAARFGGWTGRADRETASMTRFSLIGRTSLFTELGRRFGGWFHRIRPELRYLIIPTVERHGTDAFATGDELDLLSAAQQVSARLQTDLWDAATGRRTAGIEAWIARDLGAPGAAEPARGTSELVVRGDVEIVPVGSPITVRLDGRAAIDPHDALLTELIAGITLGWGATSFFVQYGRISDRMPLYTLIAPEELAPSNTLPPDRYVPLTQFNALLNAPSRDPINVLPWSGYEGVIVAASGKPIQELTLSFSVSLVPDPGLPLVRNTSSLVRWDSSCGCFGLGLLATTYRRPPEMPGGIFGQTVNLEVVVSLGRFGEVRSSQQ